MSEAELTTEEKRQLRAAMLYFSAHGQNDFAEKAETASPDVQRIYIKAHHLCVDASALEHEMGKEQFAAAWRRSRWLYPLFMLWARIEIWWKREDKDKE